MLSVVPVESPLPAGVVVTGRGELLHMLLSYKWPGLLCASGTQAAIASPVLSF